MRCGLDLELLGGVALAFALVRAEKKLDTGDAGLEGGEVEDYLFAELAARVGLFLFLGLGCGSSFVDGGTIRRRGWWKGREGGDQRVGREKSFCNALEGFLFDVEKAGLM